MLRLVLADPMWESLEKQVCGEPVEGAVPIPIMPGSSKVRKGTEALGVPEQSEQAAALAQWARIRRVLDAHGLGDLVGSDLRS